LHGGFLEGALFHKKIALQMVGIWTNETRFFLLKCSLLLSFAGHQPGFTINLFFKNKPNALHLVKPSESIWTLAQRCAGPYSDKAHDTQRFTLHPKPHKTSLSFDTQWKPLNLHFINAIDQIDLYVGEKPSLASTCLWRKHLKEFHHRLVSITKSCQNRRYL
jgi:hypothetical protein